MKKRPPGGTGGREDPSLRGDEEAWSGRPVGESRPDQVVFDHAPQ